MYKIIFHFLTDNFVSTICQLWDIEDFERKDDHHMIILNYCGYIIQRLTLIDLFLFFKDWSSSVSCVTLLNMQVAVYFDGM